VVERGAIHAIHNHTDGPAQQDVARESGGTGACNFLC
jgi:hypothetical protein